MQYTVTAFHQNQIDQDLGVYWINSWQKGILVRQKEEAISARGMLNVDSYFGHSFLVIDEEVSHFWAGSKPWCFLFFLVFFSSNCWKFTK